MTQTDSNLSAGKRGMRLLGRRQALWDDVIPVPSTGKQEEPT